MDFCTKLLHGKAVEAYEKGGTLPSISQGSALYRFWQNWRNFLGTG